MSNFILKYDSNNDETTITTYVNVDDYTNHVNNLQEGELASPTLPDGVPLKFIKVESGAVVVKDTYIDNLKSTKWNEVKVLRTSRNDEDITTTEGTWQVDNESLKSIEFGLINLTDDLDTVSWRDINNIGVEITKVQLNSILESYATRRSSIFNASINVKADIDACTTVEEVNALDVESLLSTYTI